MNKWITAFFKRYENVSGYQQKQIYTLLAGTITLMVTMILYFTIRSTVYSLEFTDRLLSLGFVVFLFIVVLFLYHRHLTHAVNSFILFIIAFTIYMYIVENLVTLYVLMIVAFWIIRITATKSYQVIVYSVFLPIMYLYMILDFFNKFAMVSTHVFPTEAFFTTVISLGVILISHIFISKVEQELKTADTILKTKEFNFAMDTYKRRKVDHLNLDQKLNENMAVIMLGIENLVELGDQFDSHEIDRILRSILGVIRKTVRIDDYIFRWDPNTFLIILHAISQSNANIVSDKILRAIRHHMKEQYQSEVKYKTTLLLNNQDTDIQETITLAYDKLKKGKLA